VSESRAASCTREDTRENGGYHIAAARGAEGYRAAVFPRSSSFFFPLARVSQTDRGKKTWDNGCYRHMS